MFQILFYYIVIDTFKNIVLKTLRSIFTRKKLLTEKKRDYKSIGYARSTNSNPEYLYEQIESLRNYGCTNIFYENLSLRQDFKPQLTEALNNLSKGDQIVFTKLDRAFKSKYECIKTIKNLLNKGIHFSTISGFLCSNKFLDIYPIIFNILYELETLEKNILIENKKENSDNILLSGTKIGGRPKIRDLKEELVVRLRKEGFSYRSIRSQTGIALSTIRRILVDYSAS